MPKPNDSRPATPQAKGNRPAQSGFAYRARRLPRHFRQRPRLILSTILGVVLYSILPDWIRIQTRLLVAFDAGAVTFLAANWFMMLGATTEGMRQRARRQDSGRMAYLSMSAIVAVAILLAIGFQLHDLKDLPAYHLIAHVVLAGGTILLSWLFMNTMFALHYAHAYYDDAPSGGFVGGLDFPGKEDPDYWDFLYFSFVIGMTFQVSDVQIAQGRLRRLALAHGVLAFFFNVVVLALTINIMAGTI